LEIKERRSAFRTIEGWARYALLDAGAIRECEEHGWMKERADPHARERAPLVNSSLFSRHSLSVTVLSVPPTTQRLARATGFEAEDTLKAKVAERETQIAGMQRQIEELRRKAEQGSQQIQGEALKLELESLLRSRFPRDLIEPVRNGEFGGDVLQRVLGPTGRLRCHPLGIEAHQKLERRLAREASRRPARGQSRDRADRLKRAAERRRVGVEVQHRQEVRRGVVGLQLSAILKVSRPSTVTPWSTFRMVEGAF
jgi:hypothetical protein